MKSFIAGRARARLLPALAVLCWAAAGSAQAQNASAEEIVDMLRDGGYVLVMRHASSTREAPDERSADPRNPDLERQLDETGRAHSSAMGYAFRQLGVEIGDVISSPAFRALETLRYLAYDDGAQVADELAAGTGHADWLRERAGEAPADGTNTLIVTHAPNLAAAFGDAAQGMSESETLVLRPDGGEARVVGRLTVEDWATLAVERSES